MGGASKVTPAFHKYGPVRVSGKAGAAAEPKVQGRAYERLSCKIPQSGRRF